MDDHEDRVVEEKAQLDGKIGRLSDFMHGDAYQTLSATDQGLLMVQFRIMKSYSQVLADRIRRFS